jgi:aminoglycoside phosphotransferase (APT) family kinase protein
MRHTCDQISDVLTRQHGVTASVVDLTEKAGGFDNELFRANLKVESATAGDWPPSVMVRVAHREKATQFVDRVCGVHRWCANHDYPVLSPLAQGALADGDAYFVMPYVEAPSSVIHLAHPARSKKFMATFVDLHLRLHALPSVDFPGTRSTFDDVVATVIESAGSTPAAVPIAEWLHQHRGDAGGEEDNVVCHFDYHPFNVLWQWDSPPVVIDWDSAGIGPRAADVAFTAELIAMADIVIRPSPVGTVVGEIGRRLSRSYLRQYAAVQPVDPLALRFWSVFQTANVLVWSTGTTFMDTVIRADAEKKMSPRLEAIVLRRFHALTGT